MYCALPLRGCLELAARLLPLRGFCELAARPLPLRGYYEAQGFNNNYHNNWPTTTSRPQQQQLTTSLVLKAASATPVAIYVYICFILFCYHNHVLLNVYIYIHKLSTYH